MSLLLRNATVVTGDGSTVLAPAQIRMDGAQISAIGPDREVAQPAEPDTAVVDVEGGYVLPGLVNHHAHGCTTGPLFSSGAGGLTTAQAWANADRHLLAGVTTLVNACGLGLPDDLSALAGHPLQVLLGTTHFPQAIEAADIVDGAGLGQADRDMTAAQMIDLGAAIIGEVGSGATLGGGVAAYKYLPDVVQASLGARPDPTTATQWLDLLLGRDRRNQVGPTQRVEFAAAVAEWLGGQAMPPAMAEATSDLQPDLPPKTISALIEAAIHYAQQPVHASLSTFGPAAELSARTGRPAVFHAAYPSVQQIWQVAGHASARGARLVAGHLNHTSLTLEEAVEWARRLRTRGVTIDVSVLDIVHGRRLSGPEIADALVGQGLVDTLSTDYAGGAWEPMLDAAARWLDLQMLDVPTAVAMMTGRPGALLDATAPGIGVLRPGAPADVVVTGSRIDDVRRVYVAGRLAAANGKIVGRPA